MREDEVMSVLRIVAAFFILMLMSPAVRATIVEDQFYDDVSHGNVTGVIGNNYLPGAPLWTGQSFQASVSGILASVQFYAYASSIQAGIPAPSNPQIEIEIWTGRGAHFPPDHSGLTLLGTLSVNADVLSPKPIPPPPPFFFNADLSSLGIPIISGTEYSFEVYGLDDLAFGMIGVDTNVSGEFFDPYPLGANYGTQPLGQDLLFRTYIDVPVPEPSTFCILGAALSVLLLLRCTLLFFG
jgi:hypothetical protein